MDADSLSLETPSLNRVSTVDALISAISRMAFAGQLKAGAPLREHELAERFSVGRHSVRSALQALAREGIAVHEPNRGVYVRRFTPAAIEDMYLLRQALETEAVREIHVRGLPRNHVDAALAHMGGLADGEDLDAMVLADLQVHRAIVSDAGSARMEEAFDSVLRELRLALAQAEAEFKYHRDPVALHEQHRELIDRIWTASEPEALEAIRAHNAEAIGEIETALAKA
jgi:DNA-binding GntR family transcriptional regulator